jgi:hypothetical protein
MPVTPNMLAGASGFSSIRTTRPASSRTGHAEVAQVLGLVDGCEQDARARRVGPKGVDHRLDRALHDVVGQHDEDRVTVDKALRLAQGLGNAAGLVLIAVEEPADPECAPVAEQPQELAGMGTPGDEHDLVDPGVDQRFNGPGDHGPVVNRQQVLVGDARERVEARAGTPRQQDTLHRLTPFRPSLAPFMSFAPRLPSRK